MMTLSQAVLATHGKLLGDDVTFTSVGTDSRKVTPGQLFVALRGEHYDGHRYTAQALQQGAAAVMVSEAQNDPLPGLLVQNTRLALGELAAAWRQRFDIPVIAVTGSNGKTTVKDMLASILHAATAHASIDVGDSVLATIGNLNNDIGLPLTLLGLRAQHRYAVAEMGMNHAGEISYLSRIARPNVALVNNATSAHLGGLGSVRAIAGAKSEIFEGLAADGIAIINTDDDFSALWASLAAPRRILTFGLNQVADVSADYRLFGDGSRLSITTPEGKIAVILPTPGLHNVRNALAATAAALAVGVSLNSVTQGLNSFSGVKGRLQQKSGVHGALLIDDSYNANPASVRAAIDVLVNRGGRKLLVIGDMGELGEGAARMHAEIGAYAKAAGVAALYALGELTQETVAAFGTGAEHYATTESLAAALSEQLTDSSTVLVKGSRFMRMERVVTLLAVPADSAPSDITNMTTGKPAHPEENY